ncbi:MAG: HAD-IA family hydrolase [Proteobacteria bacterium]|nr:HAD-IA family hydrolase [Pseudomonadota bacterium]
MGLDLTQKKRPLGVVFDMDGTLIDTEGPAREAFAKAIVEVGFAFEPQTYARCLGTTFTETQVILQQAYGPGLDSTALERAWTAHFFAGQQQAPIVTKPGIKPLLKRLQDLNIPMAVATSNQREICEASLADCQILGYFSHLVCVGEARNAKPAPDPYLLAAAKLGVDPKRCWALEDSDIGTRAAHGAGMRTFQIPDARPPSESVVALGHEVLGSSSELLALLQDND